MSVTDRLVQHRRWRLARELSLLYGLEMPASVKIGAEFKILHRGVGTVIHPATIIGDRVRIYHQVTIGRADAHLPYELSQMQHVEVHDDAVLFPGSKVLGGPGVTTVGAGTILAANSVLISSTGEWEVWAGSPARRIASRPRNPARVVSA